MEKKAPKLQPVNLKDLKKAPGHARRETGDIKKLKENIEKNGVLNPPALAITKNATLDILDGDGRIKACLELGIESLLCLVYEGLTEVEMAHLSFVLNTERANITPIEKALHIKRMIKTYGLTYTEMEALGYGSAAQISKYLDLLKAPSNTQEAIADGRLTVAHGTALLKAQDPETLTEMAIKRNWSAAKITKFIKNLDEKQSQEIKPDPISKDKKGADTLKINDGSVGFICSFLDSLACSKMNRSYLEFQIAEAERMLPDGGILALIFNNVEDRDLVAPCLSKKTLSFSQVAEFIVQLIPSNFENRAKEYVTNRKHTDYKAQTASCPILIFEKAGSRKVSPELAEESKLSEKEAFEYLRSGWIFEDENTAEEDLYARLIKMYSFKEDIVLDLFSMNKAVQAVAEKLGRRGFEKVEKNQPEEPKPEVIMSEGMAEEATKITDDYRKKHA